MRFMPVYYNTKILVVRLINNVAQDDLERRTTAGEFEGDGVVPLRGSAERSEAPRGELDSPMEVSRLEAGLWKGTYKTGH